MAISSMDGGFQVRGIIPICRYDGMCRFSVTLTDGLVVIETFETNSN